MSYRIGELAKLIGISEHTLRYYEKEGLVIPERDKKNNRCYTEENKLWAEFILHMKSTGMSVEDLKKYTALWELGDEGTVDLLEILKQHRAKVMGKIEIYQKNLELLNTKIDFYQVNLERSVPEDIYENFVQQKNSKEIE